MDCGRTAFTNCVTIALRTVVQLQYDCVRLWYDCSGTTAVVRLQWFDCGTIVGYDWLDCDNTVVCLWNDRGTAAVQLQKVCVITAERLYNYL